MSQMKLTGLTYQQNILVYFLIFLSGNTILAYGHFGSQVNLWVLFLGMFIPFFLGLKGLKIEKKSAVPQYLQDSFSVPPSWILVFLVFMAAILRLAQADIPGYWPLPDEGLNAFNSVELSHQWNWTIFYGPSQHPPLFYWTLGLFFKWVSPSKFSLHLFPLIFSFFSLMLGVLASGMVFSRSFTFLFFVLMAFSFWPLYMGETCSFVAPFVFWEFLVFFLLALLFKKGSSGGGKYLLIMLSLCVALGFWIGIAWPVVAVVAVFSTLFFLKNRRMGNFYDFYIFLFPIFLSAGYFIFLSVEQKNGAHILSLLAFGTGTDWKKQFIDSASNFSALVWGCDTQNSYGPIWGGVLNPVLGSFFFLGVLEIIRLKNFPVTRWAAWAFPVLMIPGLLTKNFDLFRNVQALPILLFIVVLGIQGCLLGFKNNKKTVFLVFPLLISIGLDLRHLWITYHPEIVTGKKNLSESRQLLAGFEILKRKNAQWGPGVLLFELRPHVANQTLAIATYPFNASINPNLHPQDVKWMAFLSDIHYRSFLADRFPKGEWFQLFSDQEAGIEHGDALMLGVIPVEAAGLETVTRWRQADQAFRKIVWRARNMPPENSGEEVFRMLPEIYPLAMGDAYLESLYWEMVFDFHRWENIYGDKNAGVHYPASFSAIRNGIQKGYPTAYFFNELGGFLAIEKDYRGAKEAFSRASHSKINFTPAIENLRKLESLKK